MGGGGRGERHHPVRAKSAGGRPVALQPCRSTSPISAGMRHAHGAAIARQARPASDGGEADVDHKALSRSQEIPPRLATDVDAGGGVGTNASAGM